MASEHLEDIGKDTDSDIPDDFFDDFGKDEFMSGLDIVDSVDSFDEAITKGTSSEDYVPNFVNSSETGKKSHDLQRKSHADSPNLSSRRSPHFRNVGGSRGTRDYRGRRGFHHINSSNSRYVWTKKSQLEGNRRSHDKNIRNYEERRRSNDRTNRGRNNHGRSHEKSAGKDNQHSNKNSNLDKSLERSIERGFSKKNTHRDPNKTHEGSLENISMDKSLEKSMERTPGGMVILPGCRRDISRTMRAIEIDKDKKARDLLEKRIRIVETGLVPPGMEADVILNDRPTGKALDVGHNLDTEKISPTPMIDEMEHINRHSKYRGIRRSEERSNRSNRDVNRSDRNRLDTDNNFSVRDKYHATRDRDRFDRDRDHLDRDRDHLDRDRDRIDRDRERLDRDREHAGRDSKRDWSDRRDILSRPFRRVPSPRTLRRSVSPRLCRSPRPPRLSPVRHSGEINRSVSRNSRDDRHSRPRSPFIKEITRKLRERSQEKHLMKMLNQPAFPQNASFAPQNASEFPPQIIMNSEVPYTGSHNGSFTSVAPTYSPFDGMLQPYQPPFYPPQQYPAQYPVPGFENPAPNPYPLLPMAYPAQPDFYPGAAPYTPVAEAVYPNPVEPVPPPNVAPTSQTETTMLIPDSKTNSAAMPSLDDLLAMKKINVADYLKLKAKPTGSPQKDKSALSDKFELISRCQNAVLKLSQFHKPNNLVYNPELEENIRVKEENVNFQSPFKKKNYIKYSYTNPLTFSKAHNEQLLNNIIATIGLQDFVKTKKETKPIAFNMKDAAVQTNTFPCDICEIRKLSKFKASGTATDDLYETCSVHCQVNESELQVSKSMYITGQSATHNPVSLTHLTPSQILANDLAAKARALRNPGNQADAAQLSNLMQNINMQRLYQGYQQMNQDSNNYNMNNQFPQGYRY